MRLFFLETSLFCCGVNNGRQKKAFCHITRRRFFLFLITGIRFDSPLIDRTYFTHPYWLRGLGSQRHHRVRFKSYLQIRSFRLCSDTKFRQHSPVQDAIERPTRWDAFNPLTQKLTTSHYFIQFYKLIPQCYLL